MKIGKIMIAAFAGVLLMTGCMTEEPIKQRATEERIKLIGNSSFTIELLNAKTMINDEGLLTVDASVLLSRTGFFRWVFAGDPQVTVWYHFTWIDSQGNSPAPVQREMAVLPGNILDFHGVAPDEKYINYHLTISLKGPEASSEAEHKNEKKQELKKTYVKDGKVKPAGRSQAKKVADPKAQKKTEAKPTARPASKAEAEPAAKKAAEKPAAKPTAKPAVKAEARPAAKKAAEKPAAKTDSKPQKLTEPFN
ncbi:MAG: hypothetical protein IKO93_20845 [Lentisphaeria bacterium]|nr:hypothetical protein [Lentisphaeria bacterium]